MFLRQIFTRFFGVKDKKSEKPTIQMLDIDGPICSKEYADDPWVQFMLLGAKPHGQSLEDILLFERVAFDTHHDFIQWLFPNRVGSPINPLAPVLSELHVKAFAEMPVLRTAVDRASAKFLEFLGLRETANGFECTEDYEKGAQYWVCRLDHNHRRISRLLTFYVEIGRKDKAESLLAYLQQTLAEANLLGIEALPYWQAIVEK
jgi:hypothetical protein